jgi:predicted negative regulator of RcsB-dependent stress response
MANLDVTRKKKSLLPWILLTLLVLAVAGYFIWRNYNQQQENTTTNTTAPATTTRDSSNHLGTDTTTRL